MNNLIGSKDLLAQLDALKNVVQDFAAREEKLNATFREQSGRERNAFDTRDHQLTTAASEQQAAKADAFSAAKIELENRIARRKTRITRVHNRISERTLTSISTQDEECKSRAQQGLIAAEKRHDTDLAQAAANFESFQQRQAESTQAFAQLEQSVRSALGGCGKFRRMLNAQPSQTPANSSGNGSEMLDELQRLSAKIDGDLNRFKKFPLPQIFRFIPIWLAVVVLAGIAIANPVLTHFGRHFITQLHAIISLSVLALVLAAYWLGMRAATPLARVIAGDFVRARSLLDASWDQAAAFHQAEQQRIETEFLETKNAVNQEWKRMSKEIVQLRNRRPTELEDRIARLYQQNEEYHRAELQRMQQAHEESMAQMRQEAGQQAKQLAEAHQASLARRESDFQAAWQQLESEWKERTLPLCETLQTAKVAAEKFFPDWQTSGGQNWQAPASFINAVKFGQLDVALDRFVGALPQDKRLALPSSSLSLPLLLTHPHQGSLLFETGKDGGGEAVSAINNIILRLLALTPPGRLELTIFDPVGLGQNFASLMHLADYESSTINSRIWTQSAQFEEKLAELNEHMEKIIQMYLRNEYATITEYNTKAGSVAEKYQFLVIASFPV
ncbi:MAG TPA: hypothetical protein VFF11_12300, partial [Candidatus Binatia bacterium]|nr:hypothetical protein [Candidatus Binatia bacterium]